MPDSMLKFASIVMEVVADTAIAVALVAAFFFLLDLGNERHDEKEN